MSGTTFVRIMVETREDDSQCHIDRQVVYVVKKFTAINRQAQVCACTVLQAQVCSCTELTITEPLAGSTFGTIRYLSCSNKRQNGLRPKRSKKIGA